MTISNLIIMCLAALGFVFIWYSAVLAILIISSFVRNYFIKRKSSAVYPQDFYNVR